MTTTSFQLAKMLALLLAGAASVARAENATLAVATLELRGEAAIMGDTVRLKQIARWTQTDQAFFREVGEMTVVRFEPEQRELTVNMADVRTMLEGAGVNVGQMSLRGPLNVKVRRLDADAVYAKQPRVEQPKDLSAFLDQQATTRPSEVKQAEIKTVEVKPAETNASESLDSLLPEAAPQPLRSLREDLAEYLAARLNLPVENLELSFPATFDRVLGVTNPAYSWRITTFRNAKLGPVVFRVSLSNGTGNRQVEVSGVARAWQDQLRVAHPVASGQTLCEGDIEVKRVLLDANPDRMPMRREAALTMQATRELRAGEVLTSAMLAPVLLVKANQTIKLVATTGTIQLNVSGIAKRDGVYGSVIPVVIGDGKEKREVFVTVTGPQEGRVGAAETKAAVSSR